MRHVECLNNLQPGFIGRPGLLREFLNSNGHVFVTFHVTLFNLRLKCAYELYSES